MPPRPPVEITEALKAVPAKFRAGLRAALAADCDGDWSRVVAHGPGNFKVYNNTMLADLARNQLTLMPGATPPLAPPPAKKTAPATARKTPAKKTADTAPAPAKKAARQATPKRVAADISASRAKVDWWFGDHALDRVDDRGITEDQVRAILANPEKRVAGDNGAAVYHGNGRRVVVNELTGKIITVTWERATSEVKTAIDLAKRGLAAVRPVQTIQPGLFVELGEPKAPRGPDIVTLPGAPDRAFDWTQLEGVEQRATLAAERFTRGIPPAVPVDIYAEVEAMFGVNLELTEAAVRHPDRVSINSQTRTKGYPILDMARGDVWAVVGLRDPQRPLVIAVYHRALLENDTHRVNHMGGGGAKKRAAVVRDADTLVKEIRKAGGTVSDGSKIATVTYRGKELKGMIPVGPTTDRKTAEAAWTRVQRQMAAIDRREKETAGR